MVAVEVKTFIHHPKHVRTLRLEDGRALRTTDETLGEMTKSAGVGQSPEPSQSLHCPTHLTDGFAKLVVQPEVFGTVTRAFSNGEFQRAADAVQIRVNPRHLVKPSCVDGAF